MPTLRLARSGAVAEWLRSGLQSRLHRFDSGRRLYWVAGAQAPRPASTSSGVGANWSSWPARHKWQLRTIDHRKGERKARSAHQFRGSPFPSVTAQGQTPRSAAVSRPSRTWWRAPRSVRKSNRPDGDEPARADALDVHEVGRVHGRSRAATPPNRRRCRRGPPRAGSGAARWATARLGRQHGPTGGGAGRRGSLGVSQPRSPCRQGVPGRHEIHRAKNGIRAGRQNYLNLCHLSR